ncbi:MAG: hypothetical protein KIT72_03720 [Polyangiaceae bacterium]|nr:hypothetical protein [Polyangiaceae bacterium]MCW5789510.1 hypothetical protein [Polyangiaceae bacterium]
MAWVQRPLQVLGLALCAAGCAPGEGEGWVHSDRLYMEDCWNGEYDLKPTFFSTNPYRDQALIRIQRGEDIEELSDGVILSVDRVKHIREELLGVPIPVGLPVGVKPIGVPRPITEAPLVSLAFYLHQTCHQQNGTIYSIDGTITFSSLFSNDPNETHGDDRLTEASFDVTVADPRAANLDGEYPEGSTSRLTGWFRYFFERGQPAQPFP